MSIEAQFERIATALERLADLAAGQNLILEGVALAAPASAEAAEAVEKAATRGRRKKAEAVGAPDAAADEADLRPVLLSPSPVETSNPIPASTPAQPDPVPLETLQAKAASVSAKKGKDPVVALIKATGFSRLSELPPEKRAELHQALEKLAGEEPGDAFN